MTSLQEIKAMLENRNYDVIALARFARAALPVIEAAIVQSQVLPPDSRYDAVCKTDDAATTFTESYPDERA